MVEVPDGKVATFREMLERRVRDWLAGEEARSFPHAELYAHLPTLFAALAGAALDPQLSPRERVAVMSALKYVVAPFDLIPEGLVGTSGFRDDLVLAAMVMDHLVCRGFAAVVRSHWQGREDLSVVVREILDAGHAMVGEKTCERLQQWLEPAG